MNLIKKTIVIILACIVTTGFANSFFFKKQEAITISTQPVELPVIKIEATPIKINEQEMFLDLVAAHTPTGRF